MRLPLNHITRKADRYGLSDRATATICIALLCHLGLVTETDKILIIDKGKLGGKEICLERNQLVILHKVMEINKIDAIYFDGRKDQILFQHEDTGGLTHLKEEHYVLVGQPQGEYLTHLTLQSENTVTISEAILSLLANTMLMSLMSLVAIHLMSNCTGGVIH